MKFKISRATRTVAQPARAKRVRRFTGSPALHSERPTRVYSLLLPPHGNTTRR